MLFFARTWGHQQLLALILSELPNQPPRIVGILCNGLRRL